MTFDGAIKSGFKKYFDFSGRASRSEFWWWVLFCFVLGILCVILDMRIGFIGALTTLSAVGTLFPSLAVAVRRLHDVNRSGWWLWGTFLGSLFFWSFILYVFVQAISGEISVDALAMRAKVVAFGLFGFSVVLLVFYCLPGSPGINRYGPPVVILQDSHQKIGVTYRNTGIASDVNVSGWVLSGFDSAGNIVRLEFDVSARGSQTLVIGRNRDVCDLVILDDGVSRRHAEITVSSTGVFIRDLGSANGTFLNGQKLTGESLKFPANGTLIVGPIELSIFGS